MLAIRPIYNSAPAYRQEFLAIYKKPFPRSFQPTTTGTASSRHWQPGKYMETHRR